MSLVLISGVINCRVLMMTLVEMGIYVVPRVWKRPFSVLHREDLAMSTSDSWAGRLPFEKDETWHIEILPSPSCAQAIVCFASQKSPQ